MIKPFNRHFFDLPLRLLVVVRRDSRKVTCRTLREAGKPNSSAAAITEEEAQRLVAGHGSTWPTVLFPGRPIAGELLRTDLAGTVFEELGGVCLNLDGMLGRGEWTDRANWIFPLDQAGVPQAPFNRFVSTRETKARTPRLLEILGRNCALQIYVPFASCDFDDCSFSVALHRDFGLVGNLDPGIEVTYSDVLRGAQKPFAEIVLSTNTIDLAPDAYGTVTAQLVDGAGKPIRDTDAELYLEPTGGYVPKQRIATEKGKAKFRVGALGLEVGDSFRVKVGFRHFTSVAELTVRVV